ncbi:MAG: hypothetical protein K2L45_09970 [Muribaculaceae bacterium]|nr:hypothetical protein [Muribaculaceae bacterium]
MKEPCGTDAYVGEGFSDNEMELQEDDMKFCLAQIEFLCAYITHMMQPYLEVDELHKLHHNAKIWTVNAAPPFTPVNLRSNHLTKEDL